MIIIKKPQVEVTDDFLEKVVCFAKEAVAERISRYKNYPKYYIERNKDKIRVELKPIEDLANGNVESLIHRLRRTKYSKFFVVAGNICGITQDVIIHRVYDFTENGSSFQSVNMGEYAVCVPPNFMVSMKIDDNIEIFPNNNREAYPPHPHFSYIHQCFGGFNEIIHMMAKAFDVPGMFEILYTYLSRYDSSSVLTYQLKQKRYPFARLHEN